MIVTPWQAARLSAAIALLAASANASAARQFAAATDVVRVYVSVIDPSGSPVEGLTATDFEVKDDGVRQQVTVFSAGELPLSLAVVVDRSFSMAGDPLRTARAGATRLVREATSADRMAIVALGSGVETPAPFDSPPSAALDALTDLQPWGTTPLGQAVEAALEALDGQRGRRAVVLFTDGRGRYDPADRADLLARVRRSDVLVYPMVVGKADVSLLVELAALSGGHAVRVGDPLEAGREAAKLTRELRRQYLIGYQPAGADSGEAGWHAISVAVPGRNVVVRARTGYFRSAVPAGASLQRPAASN